VCTFAYFWYLKRELGTQNLYRRYSSGLLILATGVFCANLVATHTRNLEIRDPLGIPRKKKFFVTLPFEP
jgi:hypothetical protein